MTDKALVVFYSRSGVTRAAGEAIAAELGADTEEIVDRKSRSGPIGFLCAGKDALLKRGTEIEDPKRNPSDYGVVVVGTPVWGGSMTPAVRTWLTRYAAGLPAKVAFFLTTAKSGIEKTFAAMEQIAEKKPVATLPLLARTVRKDEHAEPIRTFGEAIRPAAERGDAEGVSEP
jgi:flavodoxin